MRKARFPMSDPIPFLRRLFDRAVEVADPMQSLAQALPERPEGRLVVIGAGTAGLVAAAGAATFILLPAKIKRHVLANAENLAKRCGCCWN